MATWRGPAGDQERCQIRHPTDGALEHASCFTTPTGRLGRRMTGVSDGNSWEGPGVTAEVALSERP